jgi:hypothetical protein
MRAYALMCGNCFEGLQCIIKLSKCLLEQCLLGCRISSAPRTADPVLLRLFGCRPGLLLAAL